MLGAKDIYRYLEQWRINAKDSRRRMIRRRRPGSGKAKGRERWYASPLLAQGWTASATVEVLEREPHTIGRWAAAFGDGVPSALIFGKSGGPSALGETQQAELKAAVRELPDQAGI